MTTISQYFVGSQNQFDNSNTNFHNIIFLRPFLNPFVVQSIYSQCKSGAFYPNYQKYYVN
jgi:hypothetical protein